MYEGIYFFYSFGFVISRTVAVSVYASWINDESKRPVSFLHSLPLEVYDKEVTIQNSLKLYKKNRTFQAHRLLNQIHFDLVALTGHNFFKIRRGFILNVRTASFVKGFVNIIVYLFQVAAAIVTYELVLIQFNQNTVQRILNKNSTDCY